MDFATKRKQEWLGEQQSPGLRPTGWAFVIFFLILLATTVEWDRVFGFR